MKNHLFEVSVNPQNGGLDSLILVSDPDRMNWIEGVSVWGIPQNMDFAGMEENGNTVTSRYQKNTLLLEASRTLDENGLTEQYTFTNTGTYDLYFQRGELGIYATFNDNYQDAETCLAKRCHTHIWCGKNSSFVQAKKMGPFSVELALILTEGSLDNYSVERLIQDWSNDRGDFILHPDPMVLLPGESRKLAWVLRPYPAGEWKNTLLSVPDFCVISFEQETVFPDESFVLAAENGGEIRSAQVLCNGRPVDFTQQGSVIRVEYKPEKSGEYLFTFLINGRKSIARGYCSDKLETLMERRIRYIIRNQQNRNPESPLYGAYLIYDTGEKAPYFDYLYTDHNACRERFGMALFICKWLQTHPDDDIAYSLSLFEEFLLREVFFTETGEVCNNIGKDSSRIRLYNAPWVITFWCEMYRLYPKEDYLDWIERAVRDYYAKGGAKFYPNGSVFSDAVLLLRQNGRPDAASELEKLVREHVENIIRNGTNYPPHEVRFEQTIVTPAHNITASFYEKLEQSESLLAEAGRHIRILERFQGNQPDHKWHELPIRHWDGFFFGKGRLFGDTLHYWSCLSAYAFLLYGKISGEKQWENKARHCLRNLLCLFFEDGSASCAYLHPFLVRMMNPDGTTSPGYWECRTMSCMKRGEYFDPWANDQDFALYFILRLQEYFSGSRL